MNSPLEYPNILHIAEVIFEISGALSKTNFNIFMLTCRILRDGVKTLFDEGCGFHKRQGFPPLTPELLLQQHVNIVPFPSYFKHLYEFLVEFHLGNPVTSTLAVARKNNRNFAITNTFNDVSYTLQQVEIAVTHLPNLMSELNGEGLDLLISYLSPLFSDEKTQLHAFLHLFDPLAASLGPKRTKKTFLKQLLKHYDVRMSNASVVLFHQSFLSKLIMRFGMDQFLDHFLSFIVDALNLSSKDAQVRVYKFPFFSSKIINADDVHG
jgi:hypothetical protein